MSELNHLTLCGSEQVEELRLATTKYHCDVAVNPENWKAIHNEWKRTKNKIMDNLIMCCPINPL